MQTWLKATPHRGDIMRLDINCVTSPTRFESGELNLRLAEAGRVAFGSN